MIVTSAAGHCSLVAQALLIGAVAQLELLPSLWCEIELAEATGPLLVTSIQPCLLTAAKAPRQACLDPSSDEFAASQDSANVFTRKTSFLGTVDRCSRTGMSLWQGCAGEAAGERVKALVLRCLPQLDGTQRPLSESVSLFRAAAGSKLLPFAGPSRQAMFRPVHE